MRFNLHLFIVFISLRCHSNNKKKTNLVELGHDVGDVVPWVTVESLLQSLLVHVVADEADAATEHEQRVDCSHVDVFLRLLTVSDQNKSRISNQKERRIKLQVVYLVNMPQLRSMSTKLVAMTPSTFKIRFGFLLVVIFSTSNA